MSTDSTSWDILGRGWFIEFHGIIFRATMLLFVIYCVLVGEYFMDSYSIKSLTAQRFLLKKQLEQNQDLPHPAKLAGGSFLLFQRISICF